MSVRQSNYPVYSDSVGQATNPSSATVTADTGALPGGIYEVLVVCGASADAEFLVSRRNAANSAAVGDTSVIYVPAKGTVTVPYKFEIEKDERVRVVMNASLTGTEACFIQAQRVG